MVAAISRESDPGGLFAAWLLIPEAKLWQLAFNVLLAVVIVAAALLLHAGTLNYFSDRSGAAARCDQTAFWQGTAELCPHCRVRGRFLSGLDSLRRVGRIPGNFFNLCSVDAARCRSTHISLGLLPYPLTFWFFSCNGLPFRASLASDSASGGPGISRFWRSGWKDLEDHDRERAVLVDPCRRSPSRRLWEQHTLRLETQLRESTFAERQRILFSGMVLAYGSGFSPGWWLVP